MRVNFEIENNYAVTYAGRHIDLHNDFDLESFNYTLSEKEFRLVWKKSEGEWIASNELKSVIIVHKKVDFLQITEPEAEMADGENNCLLDLTYYPAMRREEENCIINQSVPTEADDIKYTFQNQLVIIVHCQETELMVIEE